MPFDLAVGAQIIAVSRSATPPAQDPASTQNMPILRRKIAVAAAADSTKAAMSMLDSIGMSNDKGDLGGEQATEPLPPTSATACRGCDRRPWSRCNGRRGLMNRFDPSRQAGGAHHA